MLVPGCIAAFDVLLRLRAVLAGLPECRLQACPIPRAIQSLTIDRFIDVNATILAMSGFRRLVIISCTPGELDLSPHPKAPLLLLLQLNQKHSVRNLEWQLRTRSGEFRDLMIVPLLPR